MILQIGTAIPSSPMELVALSSTPTKVVLAILVILSLLSWMLMVAKWREFKRAEESGRRFMAEFERAHTLDEAAEIASRSPTSR